MSSSTNPRPGLLRTASRASSIHAQTSLRRMLTHETGTGAERKVIRGNMVDDAHHEHEDEDDDHESDRDQERASIQRIPSKNGSTTNVDSGSTAAAGNVSEKDIEAQDAAGGEPTGKRKKLELQDQTNLLPVKQVIIVFVGLSMALFCSLLDQTIVVTALPTLGQAFGRADIVSWVGTSYLLTSTAMQPLYGRLSDIFGRKICLLSACVIFFLGSLACSISANMIQLICFRAIQGIGGGGILTLSMIIVSDIVTLKERGKYQGIIGMVIATANSIGPLIGGLLTEKATWRWSFWISLPLTAVAFLVILFLLPLKSVRGDTMTKLRAVDWAGSALTLVWAVLFLIGLSWAGTQYSWSSPAVLVPLILGLALLGVFLFVEMRVPLPIIPLYIFRSPTVSASMAATFFSGVAFYCTLYYLPTYLQIVHGASPIRSGVLTLPLAAVQTVTAFVAGYVTSRTGDYWWTLILGFGIWTVGLGLMTTLSTSTTQAAFVGYQIVVAIGAGQTFQTSLLAIQAAVERKDMAAATGTRNFARMLGGTVGLAACGSIVNNVVRSRLGKIGIGESTLQLVLKDPTLGGGWSGSLDLDVVREVYSEGIRGVFYLLLPLTAISFFIVMIFVKKISLKRADDVKRKEEGKQWMEERKNKRRKNRSMGEISRTESPVDAKVIGGNDLRGDDQPQTATGRIEERIKKEGHALEEAAEVIDEAAGVMPISMEREVERKVG